MGKSTRWATEAIRALDASRCEATPLRRFPTPRGEVWVKDESALPTGSLKHRAARALFRYAIASGRIDEGTTVVEATGGNAAVAQAHFARELGLPYVAVMPGDPDPARAAAVERLGGRCRFVDPPAAVYQAARELAREVGGHFLDHFGQSERAADWRDDDLATELFAQLPDPPDWVVVGAGTGATSAVLGRRIRVDGLGTRLAVVDPEHSAYFPGWATGAHDYATGMPSRIEGIGRPRMEPGFLPGVVDLVVPVPDAASVAAARLARAWTGRPVGGSTGANLWGALHLAARSHRVATLVCDAHDRHLRTYHDDGWAAARGLDPAPHMAAIEAFLAGGPWQPPPHP